MLYVFASVSDSNGIKHMSKVGRTYKPHQLDLAIKAAKKYVTSYVENYNATGEDRIPFMHGPDIDKRHKSVTWKGRAVQV